MICGKGIKSETCLCSLLYAIALRQQQHKPHPLGCEQTIKELTSNLTIERNTIPLQLMINHNRSPVPGTSGSVFYARGFKRSPTNPTTFTGFTTTWFRVRHVDLENCCAELELLYTMLPPAPTTESGLTVVSTSQFIRTGIIITVDLNCFCDVVCLPAVNAQLTPFEIVRIAFTRTAANGFWQVHTMNEDGSNQVNISNSNANEFWPTWSPDRSRIAFVRNNQLYTMNADGANKAPISPATFGSNPAWSPDGSQIAYGTSNGIFVVNLDGSGQTQLTNNISDSIPSWSPDGSKISFTRGGQIFTMNRDGTNQAPLPTPATGSFSQWSPDGTQFLYESGNQIFKMNSDGSNQTPLTFGNADFDPSWSPDGTKIVFIRLLDGDFRIFMMNADGSNQGPLPTPATGFYPAWNE